jgi:pyruvate dehydrogenase E1 component alpha subunit
MGIQIEKDKFLELFKTMVKIREFENEAMQLAMTNLTRAAVHTYNGQEAIAAGVCVGLRSDDYIVSNHRGHGHCIAKGADPVKMFAELMARETGYCKGKGGSMHIADPKIGMLGANGVVGGGIPISVGAAFGLKLEKKERIVVCFFGDGASNEGSFHEALNMASIWDLPVVFVCENNQYGISMHVTKSMKVKQISLRSQAYGIRGITIDGNKIDEVYQSFAEAAEEVRTGKGPILMEMLTYRMAGHYFGDNENYRTKEEVAKWKERDPIVYAEKLLADTYGVPPDEIDEIKKSQKEAILESSNKAKNDPFPREEDITNDLYDPTFAEITWKVWK